MLPTNGESKISNPSFRAAVVQLRLAGVEAFGKSNTNMDELHKQCDLLQEDINEVMDLLFEQNMDSMSPQERLTEIHESLPGLLGNLKSKTHRCSDIVDNTVKGFEDLLHLCMEMNIQVTATKHDADKKAKDIELKETLLKARQDAEKTRSTQQQKYLNEMKKYVSNADKRFDNALNNVPTAGQLIGMQIAQKLTDLATTGVNALIQHKMTMGKLAAIEINGAIDKALDNDPKTTPGQLAKQDEAKQTLKDKADELEDHIMVNADGIRDALIYFVNVLTSGQGGAVDWDDIKQTNASEKSGLKYVDNQLQDLQSAEYGSSKLAKEGKRIIDQAVKLSAEIKDYSEKRMEPRVKEITSEVKTLKADADKIVASAANKTKKSPVANPMQVNSPQVPSGGDENAAVLKLAVENAQFNVNITSQQLESAQQLYQKANEDMQQITENLGKFAGELAKLNIQEVDWDKVRETLIQAVALLSQLVIQLEHLRDFFQIIANSVDVTLTTAFNKFRETAQHVLDKTKNPSVGGISMNEYNRTILAKHALNASKVEYVMNRLALVCRRLYKDHISAGMGLLFNIPPFVDDSDNHKKAIMITHCTEIKRWAAETSEGMRRVLDEEKETFDSEMKEREAEFKASFQAMLQHTDPEIRQVVTSATKEHVDEESKVIKSVGEARPRRPRLTND